MARMLSIASRRSGGLGMFRSGALVKTVCERRSKNEAANPSKAVGRGVLGVNSLCSNALPWAELSPSTLASFSIIPNPDVCHLRGDRSDIVYCCKYRLKFLNRYGSNPSQLPTGSDIELPCKIQRRCCVPYPANQLARPRCSTTYWKASDDSG